MLNIRIDAETKTGFALGKWQEDLTGCAKVRSKLHKLRMGKMSVDQDLLADGHFLLTAIDDATSLIELLLTQLYGPQEGNSNGR